MDYHTINKLQLQKNFKLYSELKQESKSNLHIHHTNKQCKRYCCEGLINQPKLNNHYLNMERVLPREDNFQLKYKQYHLPFLAKRNKFLFFHHPCRCHTKFLHILMSLLNDLSNNNKSILKIAPFVVQIHHQDLMIFQGQHLKALEQLKSQSIMDLLHSNFGCNYFLIPKDFESERMSYFYQKCQSY